MFSYPISYLSLSLSFSQHHQSVCFRFYVLLFLLCLCCYHLHTLHIITDLICCVKELLLWSLLFVCLFVCLLVTYVCLIVTHFCCFCCCWFVFSSFSLHSLIGTPLYDLLGLLLIPSDVLVCFVCGFIIAASIKKIDHFPGRDGFSIKMFHRRLCLNFILYLWLERTDLPTFSFVSFVNVSTALLFYHFVVRYVLVLN